ncbi:MAG: AAA family ATPase [Pseudomonadota bacterium]
MRTIMVLNPKGGSGKSTISTNLAAYYASQNANVVLADLDPQQSALAWLEARGAGRGLIKGIDASKSGAARPARNTDVVVMDAPAAVHGKDLTALVRRAETFIVPVLPSPIDMRAAANFVAELRKNAKVSKKQAKFAVVANRVREHTKIYGELEAFLKKLKVPVLTHLRDSMNYVRCAERGIGVHELAPYASAVDREQWKPIVTWIKSKRSQA